MPASPISTNPTASSWLAVTAVSLATFSVVTTEMLPVGLLTPIAETLDISTGTAGLMISLPALLAALFAPLVVISAGNRDRRGILCTLLTLLVIANLASALAPSLPWMLGARILVGFCMGGIWTIAGGLASRLVPAHAVGMATSLIFGGVAAASVLGMPLGAWLGELTGWRWVFGSMAMLSGLVLLLQLVALPALPVHHSSSLKQFVEQFANRPLLFGLLMTVLLVAGHFLAFTFVRPLLLSAAHIPAHWIASLLFGYGLAGIAGNFLAGLLAGRHTALTLAIIALGLLLTPLLFLAAGHTPLGGTFTLMIWGLAYGGVSVGLMSWMMKAAPAAIEIATALYVGVFNLSIALGAWSGGQIVDRYGLAGNLRLMTGFAALALLLSAGLCLRIRLRTGATQR